jgi:O-antigen/teichoic acid export membrane protein
MSAIHPFDSPTVPVPLDAPTVPVPQVRPARGRTGLLSGWRAPQHRDGMALVISSGLTSGIGLLYWVVAARLFDHATVGLNSAAVSAMTLLGTAAHLNLGNAMLRFVPMAGSGARALILRCNLVASLAAVTIGGVFALGAGWWAPDLLAAVGFPALLVFFVVSTPVWTLFVLQDSIMTAIKRATAVPMKNLVFSVLKIVLLGVAVWVGTESGIAVSWVVGTVLCVVGGVLWLARAMPPAHPPAHPPIPTGAPVGVVAGSAVSLRDVAGFVRYDYAGNVCWQIAVFGLPLVVLALAGPEAAATYGIAWQIAFALYLVINGMGQSLVAHLSADPSGLGAAMRGMVVKSLTLVVPAVVVIAPGSYLLLSLFGSEYAATGSLLLALLALSAVPNVITQAAVWAARVQRRGALQIAIPATLAVAVIVGTVLLMPSLGVTGAGVAWLGAQTLAAAAILLVQLRSRRRAAN